jgi:hypothetical protein
MEVEIGQEKDGRNGGQPRWQRRSRNCQKHHTDLDDLDMTRHDLPVVYCVVLHPPPTHTSGAVSLSTGPPFLLRSDDKTKAEIASFFRLSVRLS